MIKLKEWKDCHERASLITCEYGEKRVVCRGTTTVSGVTTSNLELDSLFRGFIQDIEEKDRINISFEILKVKNNRKYYVIGVEEEFKDGYGFFNIKSLLQISEPTKGEKRIVIRTAFRDEAEFIISNKLYDCILKMLEKEGVHIE